MLSDFWSSGDHICGHSLFPGESRQFQFFLALSSALFVHFAKNIFNFVNGNFQKRGKEGGGDVSFDFVKIHLPWNLVTVQKSNHRDDATLSKEDCPLL